MVNNDEARNASSARRRPRRRRPLAGREEMDANDLEKLRARAEGPRLRRAIEDPHNRRTKPGDGPALDQGQLSSCNPLQRCNITCLPTEYFGNLAVEGCVDVIGPVGK